jgi:DNA polymerase III subunit epsilon
MDEHAKHKQAAAQWARDLLKRPFAVIDTETTGLHNRARIVSIGVLMVEDRTPRVIVDSLINPLEPIPRDSIRFHGITDDMVQTAPTFTDLYPVIADALEAVAWTGYNVYFDHQRITHECERAHLPGLRPPVAIRGPQFAHYCEYDAMGEYADFWGQYSDRHGNYTWQRLANAAKQQHLPAGQAHNAIADCWTTYHLILKMSQF